MRSLVTRDTPVIDPDELFASLLASAKHAKKKKNLAALHDICKQRFEAKGREWSYTSVGKMMEARELLTVQSLLQRQSDDYRALIDTWRNKAMASVFRSPSRAKQSDRKWHDNIDDLWARQTAAALEREVQELRKKNALLEKWKGTVTIRLDGSPVPEKDVAHSPPASLLNVQEKRALIDSISPQALSRLRMKLGARGELVSEDGVIYFGPGWGTGLAKLLQALGPA